MKTIDISAFKAEVQSLTASETPYVYQVTGLKSDMFCQLPLADIPQETLGQAMNNPLREALSAAPGGVLIDLSPTELPPLDNGNFLFCGCANMVASPRLPEGIKELVAAFANCIAMEEPPHLPDGVTNLSMAFSGMVYSKDPIPMRLSRPPIIPRSVGETDQYNPSGTIGADYIPNMYHTFSGCFSMSEAPVIPEGIKSLDNTFSYCGLSSPPEIPASVVNMSSTFFMCTNLTTAPRIPPYMENMDMAFYGCNLSEAPELPAALKTMRGAFVNNTGMTRVLNVPPTVIDLSAAFAYCTNLEVIEEFAVNVTRCNMTDAFTQCQNLRAVYTPNHSIGRIGRWRMWQLTFDPEGELPFHIEAKVFSENGAIEHHTFFEFTDADFEQGKLGIMFYHSGALGEIVQTKESDHLAEMVSQLLRYKIPVGNLPSATKRVLHIDADILSGSAFVPPGVIMPYCASSAPEGWLICDGSAVSRDEYRMLFNTIGGRYGTGDGSTTFNIPDTRSTLGQLSSIALSYIIKT